ncbi:hypothetical protein AB685_17890 [Bacillus sp. LL01]|uniref:hypothetical protein n=1 Tax=Bacillus sp. LL01 TaxID=1665556 RepID=UPI00064D2DEC|nr:hypothetical protein [Bacillus sp. LL01]KMJ57269.1 hypothetical protein AB685_17890 [Bacillus sp. LL01]
MDFSLLIYYKIGMQVILYRQEKSTTERNITVGLLMRKSNKVYENSLMKSDGTRLGAAAFLYYVNCFFFRFSCVHDVGNQQITRVDAETQGVRAKIGRVHAKIP